MLIGHYAPALMLKRARPSIPLWLLFLAVQLVDVGWGLFILGGLEHARIVPGFSQSNDLDLYYMPYTHSVVATVVWATAFALAWAALRPAGVRAKEAVVVWLAVASHFVLDLIVHLPDLPIFHGDGEKLGFGLWRHRTLALAVELGLFLVGAALVWSRRRAPLLAIMAIILVASFYVPTPPSPAAMAATGLGLYAAMIAAAAFTDRRA